MNIIRPSIVTEACEGQVDDRTMLFNINRIGSKRCLRGDAQTKALFRVEEYTEDSVIVRSARNLLRVMDEKCVVSR